ncbi:TetR family transcriptional regulator [Leucobacter sp. CSA2]|uniref:TetR family transcriptional regulator n=1 Tax=Leucobacter edaphi TaxID=2796472 RepID=A0A934UXJ8_9MICO|nr:TetR family transcriptional regulator [Leucobacter edaphi]MBK0422105.1 TetR family transcriptional regulator [Leucobacter edaphi]
MRNSLADVVSAALRVLHEHGLESCSMRRVASELDVQPSALYHHVPNKQTLLSLMADEIVREVGARTTDPREFCRELRAALLRIRDGAEVVATAAAFRLGSSRIEEHLTELVGPDGALTLILYTFGHTQSTQTHQQAEEMGALIASQNPAATDDPGDVDASRAGTAALDASFERGLDIILAGLRSV